MVAEGISSPHGLRMRGRRDQWAHFHLRVARCNLISGQCSASKAEDCRVVGDLGQHDDTQDTRPPAERLRRARTSTRLESSLCHQYTPGC
jgi:hypothetical protein